jgi:hypothetical protein
MTAIASVRRKGSSLGRNVRARAYHRQVPNPIFAFALFLSSYSPAMLILAVRSFQRSTALFWVSLAVALLSSGAFLLFIFVVRTGGPFRGTIEDVESHDAELAAYVATYLLPFIVVFGASLQDVIALALFLLFIGLLWVNSNMIYLNPLLALIGYHVYVARLTPIGSGAGGVMPRTFLLSRNGDLRAGDEVRPSSVTHGVLIDLKSDGCP